MKRYLSIILLFTFFTISFGQKKEKAVLHFSYDKSGNQIKRFFEIIVSASRSSVKLVEDSNVNVETIFQVVPNPTSGPFNIKWNTTEEIQDIEIYNLASVQIKNFTTNRNLSSVEVNISAVPAGIYILRFTTTKGKVITKKIIKK